MATLRADVAGQPDVAYVSPAQYNVNRNAAVLTVIPRTSPQDSRTSAWLARSARSVATGPTTPAVSAAAVPGSESATTSGPFVPGPNPLASRS